MRVPVLLLLLSGLLAWPGRAVAAALESYARAEIAPTKTSIYIGSVAMTMPVFVRTAGVFESTYTARVFPYLFYNEAGRLKIEVSDAQLAKLVAGEPIEFSGRALRDDGVERRVEGKATPDDARSGRIKVRVFVSRRIELIFNTTYRFPDAPAAQTDAPR